MKAVWKKIGKIALIVLISLLALLLLAWGGLNLVKFALYGEYYGAKENVCKNPGLGDGFVCQGIAVSEADGRIFVSGYMKDKSASRIYVTDFDSHAYYVELEKANGKPFTGHAGGVAVTGDTLYIANGGKIYMLSVAEVLAAKEGDSISVGEGVAVNSAASFVYTDEQYLYVGEFHDGENYITDHTYQTADGMYYAIIERYPINDLTAPDKVYAIRNKVQGACFTPDGKVMLSTSYGLTDSVYYIYNESDATPSGEVLDGAPVYYLDNCERQFKGPAMGEDLDWYGGKVITLSESASDKYIFGKFFFANKIVALDISE